MFEQIQNGSSYSRPQLAEHWGYASYHAIARGVVTPQGKNKIILFVTAEKQAALEQYNDYLEHNTLHWEGPTDHFAEQRMLNAATSGDEIHLFYRERHHTNFEYMGQLKVIDHKQNKNKPTSFTMQIDA